MHFVDNINFVFGLRWCVTRLVTNITDFFDTIVAGRIDFDDIANRSVCDPFTDFTFVTRFTVCWFWTVNGLCKDLRGTRFPVPRGSP